MATPWESIEEDYRAFLQAAGYNADDFNESSFKRGETYIAFHQFQQQQQATDEVSNGSGSASKRPASSQQTRQAKAKKQALLATNKNNDNDFQPVVTQVFGCDSKSREKMVVWVTMPGNIYDTSQLTVELVKSSNGGQLVLYVPRGQVSSNMDLVNKGLADLPDWNQKDADLFTRYLENKMMMKRRHKSDTIEDRVCIVLEKACDPNKRPTVTLFKTKDGDTACCINMDVPTIMNEYCTKDVGGGEAVMID
jgi:hypothetical protein